MPFFQYSQNNSGGRFLTDQAAGIGVDVIIEARSADEADRKAEGIGLYFNGCENDRDCSCCGDRWSEFWGEPDDEPSLYGEPLATAKTYIDWTPGEPSGYIHYLDGRVEPFKLEVK